MRIRLSSLLVLVLALGCSEDPPPAVAMPEEKGVDTKADGEPGLEPKSEPKVEAKPEAPVVPEFDYGSFANQAGSKMDSVMDRPAVQEVMDEMWDEIGADPRVSKAGGDLLGKLGSDPKLGKVTETFMAELPASPEFVAMIQKIAAENPGAGEAELQIIVAKHVETMGDRPEFDAAIDASLDRFLDRPKMQEGLDALTDAVMDTSTFKTEVASAFARKFSEPEVALAMQAKVGATPSDPQFEKKLLDHVTNPVRLEKFVVGFFELFESHDAPRKAVAELLASEELARISVDGATKIMEDPIFKARAQAAFVALLTGADQATLEQELDDMLQTPVVEESFAAWFAEIARRQELEKGIGDAFSEVVKDPKFDQLLVDSFL